MPVIAFNRGAVPIGQVLPRDTLPLPIEDTASPGNDEAAN